jgi:osmotically-inducible protein OsmY
MPEKDNFMSHDDQLQQSVLAALHWEPGVSAAQIGVTAYAGIITLTGQVESYAEKHVAETAVRRVKGVLAVAEEIEVQLPFERKRGDDQMALAVLDRIAWDASIPANAITVTVENGRVTLIGQVNWHYQREAALQYVRQLHGVVGVTNQISIKPGVNTASIGNDIGFALHRVCVPDSDAITVTEKDGKVRLSGNVHSWHARQVAAEIAWGAPGATEVENLLVVI